MTSEQQGGIHDLPKEASYSQYIKVWSTQVVDMGHRLHLAGQASEVRHVLVFVNRRLKVASRSIDEIEGFPNLVRTYSTDLENFVDLWYDLKQRSILRALEMRSAGNSEIKAAVRQATDEEIADGFPSPRVAVSIWNEMHAKDYTSITTLDALKKHMPFPQLVALIGTSDPWPDNI